MKSINKKSKNKIYLNRKDMIAGWFIVFLLLGLIARVPHKVAMLFQPEPNIQVK